MYSGVETIPTRLKISMSVTQVGWNLKYLDPSKRYNHNHDTLPKGKVEEKYITMKAVTY